MSPFSPAAIRSVGTLAPHWPSPGGEAVFKTRTTPLHPSLTQSTPKLAPHAYFSDFVAVFIINIIFFLEHPFKGEMKSNHLQRK